MAEPAPGRWHRVASAAGLVDRAGLLAPTIFAQMTALADRTGSVNLGQGAPDTDPPAAILEAAKRAIDGGVNQYSPGKGHPALLDAIAEHQRRFYSLDVDPATEILVTTGATEALTATLLALVEPGQEVVVFEPFYDSYVAAIELAGGVRRTVALDAPDFSFSPAALAAAFTEKTAAVILNTPHNPTGKVFGLEELRLIAAAAERAGCWIITDEVYEHLVFEDSPSAHIPMATLPGAAERTITISSAGKTFSVTGWKIGWLHGPAGAVAAIQAVKQFLTYVSGAPFQPAVAEALDYSDSFFRGEAASLATRRDLLGSALSEGAGLDVLLPRAGYFVLADVSSVTDEDALSFCRTLPERCGVVGVPVIALCTPDSPQYNAMRTLVRFAFCKRTSVLTEAAGRLRRLSRV